MAVSIIVSDSLTRILLSYDFLLSNAYVKDAQLPLLNIIKDGCSCRGSSFKIFTGNWKKQCDIVIILHI